MKVYHAALPFFWTALVITALNGIWYHISARNPVFLTQVQQLRDIVLGILRNERLSQLDQRDGLPISNQLYPYRP